MAGENKLPMAVHHAAIRQSIAGERKVQKVARQAAIRQSIGACKCGGELIWARVILTRPRMMIVCETCGTVSRDDA
jgi:hypothetical protein